MTPPGNPEFQTPLLGMLALMAASSSSSSSCLWLLPLPSAPGFCLQAPGALYGWAWQLPNPQTLLHIPPTPSPTPTNTTPMLQALTGTVVGRAQRAIPTTRHPLPQSPDLPAWWVGGCTAWGYLDALKHSGVYYIIGELRYSVIDSSNHKVIPAPLMSKYLSTLFVRGLFSTIPLEQSSILRTPPPHPTAHPPTPQHSPHWYPGSGTPWSGVVYSSVRSGSILSRLDGWISREENRSRSEHCHLHCKGRPLSRSLGVGGWEVGENDCPRFAWSVCIHSLQARRFS